MGVDLGFAFEDALLSLRLPDDTAQRLKSLAKQLRAHALAAADAVVAKARCRQASSCTLPPA
jgi:predicted transcriptional regulator